MAVRSYRERALTALVSGAILAILLTANLPTSSVASAHTPLASPTVLGARSLPASSSAVGSSCGSLQQTNTNPVLLPTICVNPSIVCKPGTSPCSTDPSSARVHMWVNASSNSSIMPWVQVVFVVETTVFDGAYDPSSGDYGNGVHGASPCSGPCEESDGDPFFVHNVGQITQGITQKNTGVTSSSHVTFAMVDYFSTEGADHDDGDGSEYSVDVSTFQPATTFTNTVTSAATAGTLWGANYVPASSVYGDSDYSDNFLSSSMITAFYGALHGSGLGWVSNSSTYHVIVWIGSTLPRDKTYQGDWCVTYNDYATHCRDPTQASEPSYTFGSGLSSPAGETLANIATLAKSENVLIDTIDLADGMTELNSKDYFTTNSTAATDVKNILGAGCYLAQSTGGSWEGPTPTNTGVGFTCAAAPSGSGGAGNLTNTFRTSTNGNWGWTNNPSLGWALTNINFPPTTISYNFTGHMREGSFQFTPAPGFTMGMGGFAFSCSHNGLNITSACQSAWSYPVGTGHGWSWPLTYMYPGDEWSVAFNINVSSSFPNSLVNTSVPVDLCLNSSSWTGCTGTGGPPYTTVTYTNYTNALVQQSFPPAFTKVAPFSSIPVLSSVAITPPNATMNISSSQSFTASPVCSGGTCPSGTTYTWSLNNSSLGTLSATSGPTVTFTAGAKAGTVTLFANGTLYSLVVRSSPVFLTIRPLLSTVSIAPTAATILNNTSLNLSAITSCNGGSCPTTGIAYTWALNNSLGNLSSTTGGNVVFTAGSLAGNVSVSLSANWNGATVTSTPTIITISTVPPPPLTGVTVTPTSATVSSGGLVAFTATPVCSGTCTKGAIYSWTLSNLTLGTLNSSLLSDVTFQAGSRGGNLSLFVNVTLNGQTHQSSPVPITIKAPPPVHLTSVAISPMSSQVAGGGSATFTAIASCTAACPSSVHFTWILGSWGLGSLSTLTGPSTVFTAGTIGGLDLLYVNATLNTTTIQSQPSSINITTQATSQLTAAAISPASMNLKGGVTQAFTARLSCTQACPAGAIYSWSLNNWLGTLDSYSGPEVNFTAGNLSGNISLFLNVSLNGVLVEATPVDISIQGTAPPPSIVLTSLSLSPTNVTLRAGSSTGFTAMPLCTGGPCPTNLTYLWRLSSNTGTLSTSSGSTVTYRAPAQPGTVTVSVTVVYGTTEVNASTTVTIVSAPPTSTGGNGSGWLIPYLLVGAAVGGTIALALVALWLRKRRRGALASPTDSQAGQVNWGPNPPS